MITFEFDGVDFSEFLRVNDIKGRGIAPTTASTVKIPGRPGVRVIGKSRDEREITISFTIVAESLADLRETVDELSFALSAEQPAPLSFSDEPDKNYYAVAVGVSEMDELITYGMGTITFLCADPLKYSTVDRVFNFNGGEANVVNNGTATAEPVFELTADSATTYVDIFTGDAYMRVGRPADASSPQVEKRTRVLADPMNSLTGWAQSGTMEQGLIGGTMSTNGYTFQAHELGTESTQWHGPALQRSIPYAPFRDFEVEVHFDMLNPTPDALGRMVVELLDTNGSVFARMNMNKRAPGSHGNEGVVRVGGLNTNHTMIESMGHQSRAWKDFRGVLRIGREGNVWSAYVAKVDRQTQVHTARAFETFTDVSGSFNAPLLAQVRLHIGQFGNREMAPIAIHDTIVTRINDTTPEERGFLLNAGDTLTIDHRDYRDYNLESPIRINGENAYSEKDFGATFFDLPRGDTKIMVEPSGSISGRVWFRERFL